MLKKIMDVVTGKNKREKEKEMEREEGLSIVNGIRQNSDDKSFSIKVVDNKYAAIDPSPSSELIVCMQHGLFNVGILLGTLYGRKICLVHDDLIRIDKLKCLESKLNEDTELAKSLEELFKGYIERKTLYKLVDGQLVQVEESIIGLYKMICDFQDNDLEDISLKSLNSLEYPLNKIGCFASKESYANYKLDSIEERIQSINKELSEKSEVIYLKAQVRDSALIICQNLSLSEFLKDIETGEINRLRTEINLLGDELNTLMSEKECMMKECNI